jgi:hypothetical protein
MHGSDGWSTTTAASTRRDSTGQEEIMKATFVRDVSAQGYTGTAHLYRCEAGGPLPEYVVVSATSVIYTGPETYVFAANADGDVTNWGELDGSSRGDLDIPGALRFAGYDPS